MRLNPITLTWHAADLVVQAEGPRWFRILYALLGLVGNLAGAGQPVEISRTLANRDYIRRGADDWLTSSHPVTRN